MQENENIDNAPFTEAELAAECAQYPVAYFTEIIAREVNNGVCPELGNDTELKCAMFAVKHAEMETPADALALTAYASMILRGVPELLDKGEAEVAGELAELANQYVTRAALFLEEYTGMAAESFTGKRDTTTN